MARSKNSKDIYSGFWVRLCALMTDIIIFFSIALVCEYFIVGSSHELNATLFRFFLKFAISLAYFWILQTFFMGTLGKYAFGIRLVNRSFSQPSYKQMFTRWLMTIPSALVLCAGFFSVGWHPKKQGWHDRIAKTVVVTKNAIRLKSTKKGTQNKNAA